MVEILAMSTPRLGCEMPETVEAARAEALFMSTLQPSESPAPDLVRRAVAMTLRRLGIGGCSTEMASEFGDHPDTAATRMTWALATIRAAGTKQLIPGPSASRPRCRGRARF
jgi:hypothetical protein